MHGAVDLRETDTRVGLLLCLLYELGPGRGKVATMAAVRREVLYEPIESGGGAICRRMRVVICRAGTHHTPLAVVESKSSGVSTSSSVSADSTGSAAEARMTEETRRDNESRAKASMRAIASEIDKLENV